MIIRPATSTDLPQVCALHIANWRDDYKGILPDNVLGQPLSEEMQGRWSRLPSPPAMVLIAEHSGTLLGFGLVFPDHADVPLLESLHVTKDARGAGVDRSLMQALVSKLRSAGYSSLWLDVLNENHAAREFYTHLGGAEGPLISDEWLGCQIPARIVRWPDLSLFPEIE